MNNYKELIEIQKKLEKGEIEEKDLDDKTVEELIELYQISINRVKESIKDNKKRIIKIRNRMRMVGSHFPQR